jgi:hypothetical protein
MNAKQIEYKVIANMINSLGVMCAANEHKILDLLSSYLFDKEESNQIRKLFHNESFGE